MTGNSSTNRLAVRASGSSSMCTINAAAISINHCSLYYITAIGASARWELQTNDVTNYAATARGDGTGLTGIDLFVLNAYWVGGSGTWTSTSPSHWAATSGGTANDANYAGYCTNVHFDANSFSVGSNVVQTFGSSSYNYAYCSNMDWTGALYSPQLNIDCGTTFAYGYLYTYGTFTGIPTLTINHTNSCSNTVAWYFGVSGTSQTINFNGATPTGNSGFGYIFSSNITLSSAMSIYSGIGTGAIVDGFSRESYHKQLCNNRYR